MIKGLLLRALVGGSKDILTLIFGGLKNVIDKNKESEGGGKGKIDNTRLISMLIVVGLLIMFAAGILSFDQLKDLFVLAISNITIS